MEKLAVILLSLMLQTTQISGATDCTPPWMYSSNPLYAKVVSKTLYRCPSLFGDSNKAYCCYNHYGDVECCNFQDYFVFRFVCLIPIIIIGLIVLFTVVILCCFMCPLCILYGRLRTRRSCSPPTYLQSTGCRTGFSQRPTATIYSNTNFPNPAAPSLAEVNQDASYSFNAGFEKQQYN